MTHTDSDGESARGYLDSLRRGDLSALLLHARVGVTTRKWRICPTFKNVSGIQVGLTVDVVAFSALRAS